MARCGILPGTYRHSIRPQGIKYLPHIYCKCVVMHKKSKRLTVHKGDTIKKEFLHLKASGMLRVVRIESYMKLRDVKQFHRYLCDRHGRSEEDFKNDCKSVQLSSDGVAMSKSGQFKLHIVSARIGLREIYPVRALYLLPKSECPEAQFRSCKLLKDLIMDIEFDQHMCFEHCAADLPERLHIKGFMGHKSPVSCELCTARGIQVAKRTHWGLKDSLKGKMRTMADIRAAVTKLRSMTDKEAEEYSKKVGIRRGSSLLDIPNQDLRLVTTPDEFHLIREVLIASVHIVLHLISYVSFPFFQGIGKSILKTIFFETKSRYNKAMLRLFNDTYLETKVLSEFSRTPRDLTARLKGSELLTIIFGLFPRLVELMSMPGKQIPVEVSPGVFKRSNKARMPYWTARARVCSLLLFLSRLYFLEDEEYMGVKYHLHQQGKSLDDLHQQFYKQYEDGFCRSGDRKDGGHVQLLWT